MNFWTIVGIISNNLDCNSYAAICVYVTNCFGGNRRITWKLSEKKSMIKCCIYRLYNLYTFWGIIWEQHGKHETITTFFFTNYWDFFVKNLKFSSSWTFIDSVIRTKFGVFATNGFLVNLKKLTDARILRRINKLFKECANRHTDERHAIFYFF